MSIPFLQTDIICGVLDEPPDAICVVCVFSGRVHLSIHPSINPSMYCMYIILGKGKIMPLKYGDQITIPMKFKNDHFVFKFQSPAVV